MGKIITKILASILVAALSIVTISEAQTVKNGGLNAKQENMVTIAAFAANGEPHLPLHPLHGPLANQTP